MNLKHKSRSITEGPERAPARAMLKGIGRKNAARRGEQHGHPSY
jgi:hypothetical protein